MIKVNCNDGTRIFCILPGQPTFATTNFQYALVLEVHIFTQVLYFIAVSVFLQTHRPTRSPLEYTLKRCFLAYPINVIPYLSAISIESELGEVREIKMGACNRAAFCSIS